MPSLGHQEPIPVPELAANFSESAGIQYVLRRVTRYSGPKAAAHRGAA